MSIMLYSFSISHSVTQIYEYAFSNCSNLRKVKISTNPNLQTIEKEAFSSSNIKEIFIPYNVTQICKGVFSFCFKLQIIEIPEESQLQSISISSFKCNQEHTIIMIPSPLKILIDNTNIIDDSDNFNDFDDLIYINDIYLYIKSSKSE